MRILLCCLSLSVLLAGCGGSAEKVVINNAGTPAKEDVVASTPTPAATPKPSTTADAERPVEFTYLGLTQDKQAISYKIKVNTEKPVSQVDLQVKYMDDAGKVLEETTVAWQNIVKSKRQPIEQGKTYETDGYLAEGATKAEVKLKRVHFADGTRWEAN